MRPIERILLHSSLGTAAYATAAILRRQNQIVARKSQKSIDSRVRKWKNGKYVKAMGPNYPTAIGMHSSLSTAARLSVAFS